MPTRFNPNNARQLKKLNEAREYSRRRLEPFRRRRLDAIQQMVGGNYSDSGTVSRVPINLIDLAINIYRRFLAARNPAVLVTTQKDKLKPQSLDFEAVMNHVLREIWFEQSLYRWVTDAMLGPGMLKVGITSTASDVAGFLADSGQPFADAVDLDDWCHDMTVKRWEQIAFSENRYSLPLEYVQESKLYSNKSGLAAASTGRLDNEDGERRVESLQRSQHGDFIEFRDTIELWDTWLPYDGLIVTTVAEQDGRVSDRKPLRVVEWEGPEEGPYYRLTFSEVPNNTMPLPPVALLMDLHELANQLFVKLGRQALRQKKIQGFRAGSDEDAMRITQTPDGEGCRLDSPGDTNEMNLGGISQDNLAFFLQVRDLFVYLGGNLDALGGLSQASTLGQEELLTQGAGARVIEWRDRTELITKRVVKAIGNYVWHDPARDDEFMRKLPGTDLEVLVKFNEKVKEGDFLDYNVDIQPYSMQDRTPAERVAQITAAIERYYIPLAPQFEAKGITINAEALFDILARYTNTPELREILDIQSSPEQMTGPKLMGEGGPKQQPHTRRENVRINKSESTRQGRDNALTQTLLGKPKASPSGLPS